MNEKVLCVDDEPAVTEGYRRALRKRIALDLATSGEQALEMLRDFGPYAVIVSDLRMPGMDGIELLSKARDISPETVRILLTGFADLKSAIEAVEQANVFRLLSKPCSPESLASAIEAGIQQYRLVTAEHDLLQKTLSGTIRILMDILSMVSPELFGRTQKLRQEVRTLAKAVSGSSTWETELAAMLAPLGLVSVPHELLTRWRNGAPLTHAEHQMIMRIPQVGSDLLANVPRLEPVAEIVLYHQKLYNGGGYPPDAPGGEHIPIGARVIKVCLDLNDLTASGMPLQTALEVMQHRDGWYDPKVLAAAYECFLQGEKVVRRKGSFPTTVAELRLGQTLAADLVSNDGNVVVPSGQLLTVSMLERIRNYARLHGVREPVYVADADTDTQSTRAA